MIDELFIAFDEDCLNLNFLKLFFVFLFDNNLYLSQALWSILPLHNMEKYAFFVKKLFGKSSSYLAD
jgi:hypothetical protein